MYKIINILDKNFVIYENGELFDLEEKRFLIPHKRLNGYLDYCISNNGDSTYKTIHRLVAETFIPNPNNLPCIDHINTIRTDNRIENLRWCTHEENMNNPITLSKLNKDKAKGIIGFDKNGNEVCRFTSLTEAVKNGYSNHIGEVANGKRNKSNKLYWKWAN